MSWVLIRITHNIGFDEEMVRIIFQLSSNMHTIFFWVRDRPACSSTDYKCYHKIPLNFWTPKMFAVQEAFHVYLNKFEIVVTHLCFVILYES